MTRMTSSVDLRNLLSQVSYRNRDRCLQELQGATSHYRGLVPKIDNFTFNDGIQKKLVNLSGKR